MNRAEILRLLRNAAITGNVLFILWMTWNGIDEGFAGTLYEKLSYLGLTSLLILESWLLLRQPTK